MPKIRDLGINVIPETMRPPEIGPGGGGGGGCHGTYGGGPPDCPNTTFPTTGPGNWPCGTHTMNCPNTTFVPPTTGYWTCGHTQNCPNTTFPTTGPDYQMNAGYAQGCPNTTFQQQSLNCYQPRGGLTRDAIQQLKEQLQQQIAQLDEYAKSIGPKTLEEIDAREKQLREELEDLARRRKEYESSK